MMNVGSAVGWWDLGEDILKRHRNLRGWEEDPSIDQGLGCIGAAGETTHPRCPGWWVGDHISWLGEARQRGRRAPEGRAGGGRRRHAHRRERASLRVVEDAGGSRCRHGGGGGPRSGTVTVPSCWQGKNPRGRRRGRVRDDLWGQAAGGGVGRGDAANLRGSKNGGGRGRSIGRRWQIGARDGEMG